MRVRPFQLVWFIADGEIEALELEPDRVREQLAQVKRAWAVMRQFSVVIAREQVVVAIAEYDADIRRRAGGSDFHPADMDHVPRFRIRRQVEIEFTLPRPGKDVGDSLARECPAFLLHQDLDGAPCVVAIGCVDVADLAVSRHVPAFGAVAPARRRGALGGIEFLPVVAEPRQMRAAGVARDVEMSEWIDLLADRVRHLLQLDPIETQQRIGLEPTEKLAPDAEEAVGRHSLRKVAGDERGVVVAQIEAEPAQSPHRALGHDAERQHQGDLAVAIAADGDGGPGADAHSDMPLPRRQPREGLERGAIGDRLETAPLAFDRVELAVDREAQVGAEFAQTFHLLRQRGVFDVGRRSRVRKRRQCRRTCHGIHRRDRCCARHGDSREKLRAHG